MNVLRVVALASLWCVLTRELSFPNVVLGLAISTLLVVITGAGGTSTPEGERSPRPRLIRALGRRTLLRPLLALELAAFFFFELVISNVRIALLVLRREIRVRPVILAVPVETESEEELAILSDLITLTPGTLSLDVNEDGKTLMVHVLSASDPQKVRQQIREGLARRVRRLFA